MWYSTRDFGRNSLESLSRRIGSLHSCMKILIQDVQDLMLGGWRFALAFPLFRAPDAHRHTAMVKLSFRSTRNALGHHLLPRILVIYARQEWVSTTAGTVSERSI